MSYQNIAKKQNSIRDEENGQPLLGSDSAKLAQTIEKNLN
jgi:hypothetical protein